MENKIDDYYYYYFNYTYTMNYRDVYTIHVDIKLFSITAGYENRQAYYIYPLRLCRTNDEVSKCFFFLARRNRYNSSVIDYPIHFLT